MEELIDYPYLPDGRIIQYVPSDDQYMHLAKIYTLTKSLDKTMPTGSIIVKNDMILGVGANGSDYHEKNICERVKQNIPTGQGYEMCEGCHPDNHSERRAIEDAESKNNDTRNADLYLWGHWWCCEPCWDTILSAGIKNVFLLKDSEKLFNKKHKENIVGKQYSLLASHDR